MESVDNVRYETINYYYYYYHMTIIQSTIYESTNDATNTISKKSSNLNLDQIKYNYATIPKDAIAVNVLFTHQKLKKNKNWRDGTLYYYDGKNKAILYDSYNVFQERQDMIHTM